MSKVNEKLKKLLDIIIKKLKWGDLEEWTHANFQQLSDYIFRETNIKINPRTLKRIFGKEQTNNSVMP